MGQCLEKITHEECGGSGLQVYLDSNGEVNGFCWSCGTYVDDPYDGKEPPKVEPKTEAELQEEVDQYVDYPTSDLTAERMLRRASLKYFGVRSWVSEMDGVTPQATLFPYGAGGKLLAWKVATLGGNKKQWFIGSSKDAMPFGWARAIQSGQRVLYITEGEYDAIALWQILKDDAAGTQYADQNPAVISLKDGAGSAKRALHKWKREIDQHFREVVLVFDQDDAGKKAAEEVCRFAPNWRQATLPFKDANECLIKGASKACKNAVVFRSERPRNSRLVKASSLHEVARVQAEMGLSTPWEPLTEMSRGFRRGETWYWGAGVKMGKSEIVNTVGAHMISDHQTPVLLIKPEEANNKSYKMLASKLVGRIFHDPNVEFDFEAYDRAGEMIGDLATFIDVHLFLNWEHMKEDIAYAAIEEGVKDVFIDPITCFTNTMSAAETNEFLNKMTAEVGVLAKDLDITVHLFCHLKAPESGLPHERGGQVYSTQFAGGRGMMRACNYMVGIEGNKDPDLPLYDRNTRTIKLLEDREFGVSGKFDVYWDHNTGLFNLRGGA